MQLKKVKMDLLKHIDGMKEQDTSLKAQVAKLQQQLAVEYKKYFFFQVKPNRSYNCFLSTCLKLTSFLSSF